MDVPACLHARMAFGLTWAFVVDHRGQEISLLRSCGITRKSTEFKDYSVTALSFALNGNL